MKSMIDVGRLIGLVGLILLIVQGGAAGIRLRPVRRGSTSVECTGVDPDGYFTMPGSSTTVTVHSGAQVNGPIFLDGDDTLNVQPGGTISDGLIGGPAFFSTNGSQVNNAGTITAEGDSANFGIAGINSARSPTAARSRPTASIRDGHPGRGDDVRVANSGTIQGTGGSLATGIYGGGTYTVTITNSGTITTDGMANGHGLVAQAGTFAQAANSGTIETDGTASSIGMQVSGGTAQATNSGAIHASGTMYGVGLWRRAMRSGHQQRHVDARGGLMAEGLVALAGMGPLQVTNSGTITSSASAAAAKRLACSYKARRHPNQQQRHDLGQRRVARVRSGRLQNSTITNSGTISGTTASIWGMSLNQTVINTARSTATCG